MGEGLSDAAPPLEQGRYRLIDVLGEGGMAVVYRAWDSRLEVWRAIKVLNAQLTNRTSIRIRFENEARTMAKLHHRNIVTIHDVGRDQQRVFMVMEMVEGGSLVDWVEANGPMPPRMAIDVMKEVLVALQAAHSASVIHRDIKPHNILIGRDGTPKVTDFGIARLADTDHSFTKTGAMMGTWTYMAPEQRTSARRVDGRADVYAAAATLYALVTAKEPFDLYTTELHDELFAGIPVDVAEVIKTGTRYRPNDRYASADAFREALGTLEGEYPAIPAGTPALVVHALSRGTSAPPPPPLEEEDLPAQSDPTFFIGETRAGTLGVGGLQEVAAEASVAPGASVDAGTSVVPEPSIPSDGTLSGETDSDVVSLPSPVLRTPETSITETTGTMPRRRAGWAPWVLVGVLSVALLLSAVTLGGVGVALFAGDQVFWGSAAPEPALTDGDAEPVPEPSEEVAEPSDEVAEPSTEPAEGPEETPGTADEEVVPMEEVAPAEAAPPPVAPRPTPVVVSPPAVEPTPEPKRIVVVHPVAEPEPEPEPEPITAPVLVELRVNSVPYYSLLYIDGSHVGRTPFTGQVPAGSHGLVLEGTKGGRKEITVDLVGGQGKLVCWDYNAGAECQRR